jgi:hypothetical protein
MQGFWEYTSLISKNNIHFITEKFALRGKISTDIIYPKIITAYGKIRCGFTVFFVGNGQPYIS